MRIRWLSIAAVALVAALVPATAPAQAPEGEDDIAHKIKGTVVSVDTTAGTVQVRVGRPCHRPRGRGGPREEGSEPGAGASQRRGRKMRPRVLTISTDASTRVRRNRAAAQLSDLVEGDRVTVVILTDEETTLGEALEEPADVISAKAKPEDESGETPEPPADDPPAEEPAP